MAAAGDIVARADRTGKNHTFEVIAIFTLDGEQFFILAPLETKNGIFLFRYSCIDGVDVFSDIEDEETARRAHAEAQKYFVLERT